jgi:hypothetical protein
MTQEAIIKCLQNGPLTSYQIENVTGIPRTAHCQLACTKMFRYKKQLTVEKIKMGTVMGTESTH